MRDCFQKCGRKIPRESGVNRIIFRFPPQNSGLTELGFSSTLSAYLVERALRATRSWRNSMKLIKTRFSYAALIAFITLIAATFATAQGPGPVDYSKTEIKATKLSDNFYTLQSVPALQRPGGTMGALVGPEGVLMIDNQFGPLSDKIVATVKTISSTPIRFMVNTHLHGDHTGGNENFGKMGVVLFARDE